MHAYYMWTQKSPFSRHMYFSHVSTLVRWLMFNSYSMLYVTGDEVRYIVNRSPKLTTWPIERIKVSIHIWTVFDFLGDLLIIFNQALLLLQFHPNLMTNILIIREHTLLCFFANSQILKMLWHWILTWESVRHPRMWMILRTANCRTKHTKI